jgi:hypothetical protein
MCYVAKAKDHSLVNDHSTSGAAATAVASPISIIKLSRSSQVDSTNRCAAAYERQALTIALLNLIRYHCKHLITLIQHLPGQRLACWSKHTKATTTTAAYLRL